MDEDKGKTIYELALLLKGEEDLASAITLVKQHNGEVVSEPRAKKLALAYKIKGNTEAVFAYVTFQASGSDVKALEHDLQTRVGVIRSMIVITPAQAERPAMPGAMPMPPRKRVRPATDTARPAAPRPLSNEALEKKIEEILQ